MSHATHANAALTPRARLKLARLIVDAHWPPARAAERYDVSWKTAKNRADRYQAEGPAGMLDRSSRRHTQAHRTSPRVGSAVFSADGPRFPCGHAGPGRYLPDA